MILVQIFGVLHHRSVTRACHKYHIPLPPLIQLYSQTWADHKFQVAGLLAPQTGLPQSPFQLYIPIKTHCLNITQNMDLSHIPRCKIYYLYNVKSPSRSYIPFFVVMGKDVIICFLFQTSCAKMPLPRTPEEVNEVVI